MCVGGQVGSRSRSSSSGCERQGSGEAVGQQRQPTSVAAPCRNRPHPTPPCHPPGVLEAHLDHEFGMLLDQVLVDLIVKRIPGCRRGEWAGADRGPSIFNAHNSLSAASAERRPASRSLLNPRAGFRLRPLSSAQLAPTSAVRSSSNACSARMAAATLVVGGTGPLCGLETARQAARVRQSNAGLQVMRYFDLPGA